MVPAVPYLTYSSDDGVQRIEITRKLTGIGSSPDNKVHIADPAILPHHCQVLRDGKNWVLSSLDREALIMVNGKERRHYKLQDGDLLMLGGTELAWSVDEPTSQLQTTMSSRPRVPAVFGGRDPRFDKLVRFSEKLLAGMGLSDVFKVLLDSVISLTGASKGFLIHISGDRMVIPAARNVDRVDIGSDPSQVSDSVVARVIKERKPIIISDAMNDTILGQSRSVVDLQLKSVMCVPLQAKDSLIGVLYVGNEGLGALFGPDDLELLKVFAAQAGLILQNALLLDELRVENLDLARDLQAGSGLGGAMIGGHQRMLDVFRTLDKIAPTDISLLVTGETGTGKELVARELHSRSNRRDKPFVSINCGAIPENLLESELFGHKKGAFTGAVADKQGKFEDANTGTLFLDEIGEMPMNLQVKLLRVLQQREIERVGEGKPRPVDIRVVSATNKILADEIASGRFREDLFYRLNEIHVELPPLRDRGDDVVLIAQHILARYKKLYPGKASGFSSDSVDAMRHYVWPGNIRQMENRIKKGLVLSDGPMLTPADLGFGGTNKPQRRWKPLNDAREDWQTRYIKECLEAHEWNKAATARALDVDPRTIFRYVEKFKDD
ncbi:MAG: sigma 54-interacting transcriptional regulator [Deltaproteobacteria bacterium]|nr:sigma 54-interacting transcriptional regulator [Deltaproteobacteria bacterium]